MCVFRAAFGRLYSRLPLLLSLSLALLGGPETVNGANGERSTGQSESCEEEVYFRAKPMPPPPQQQQQCRFRRTGYVISLNAKHVRLVQQKKYY